MTFEVGQRVRVLPGARSVDNHPEDEFYFEVAGDKTVIIERIREDGDLAVRDSDGMLWSFASEFLEALEETPEVKVGDKVRVTRDFVVGRNDGWRLIVDDLDRTSIVVEGAKVEILERAHVAPKVGDFVDPQGDYKIGTVAVLNDRPSSVTVRTDSNRWYDSVLGESESHDLLPDRWKIIYIPEESK